jgi:hypothetical protein
MDAAEGTAHVCTIVGSGQSLAPVSFCPETSGGMTKFSEDEADCGEAQESQRRAIEV